MSTPAVGSENISKIVGYKITKGDYRESSPNLPQRVAILGEANTAQQSGLSLAPVEITSAQQAGKLYGFGSPIYNMSRILFPTSGGPIGGISVVVYPQLTPGGATARIQTITATGNATANGTHTVMIGGRTGLDGVNYDYNVVVGDTPTIIAGKIADAVNAVLGSPVSATSSLGVVTLPTKWAGLTAQDVKVGVSTGKSTLGITYAVVESTAGVGTPSVAAALELFGNEWNTIVINSYGAVPSVMDALENFNGIPDPETPTGRYRGIIMKPFIALTGSVLDNPTTITDSRKLNVTIAICPAPGSDGHPYEAAANMAALFARVNQDTPHLDVSSRNYYDMPTPVSIGSMAQYVTRDQYVKKGCSTVELNGGFYRVVDFVTTYHPDGETPPQFRYCRNLNLDFNIRYGYYLIEQANVVDHAIAADNDVVSVEKVIKPKQLKQLISGYADDLSRRALIVSPTFTTDSISVDIDTQNPDRLNAFFRYKRSGYLRIASTTAEAGFNFGNLN